jgi:hypothetical protein
MRGSEDVPEREWRMKVRQAFKVVFESVAELKAQALELAKVQGLEASVRELHQTVNHKPTQEELRRSFVDKLEKGVPAVTLDEVAAYHGKYAKWVLRREAEGAIKRLKGYGRRAMFDPRVASRLRPNGKEG